MFPLCRTCAEKEKQDRREHDEEQRSLTKTWVSIELNKALEKGYKPVEIYEVMHFPKNYAFRTHQGKEVRCKIRGFTLNIRNSRVLNFESMRNMIQNQMTELRMTVHDSHKIEEMLKHVKYYLNRKVKYTPLSLISVLCGMKAS